MPPVPKPKRNRHRTFIAEWRAFKGLTQDRVAERIGISRENYGRIESGKIPYNQDTLELCADALGCSASDLLERDPNAEKMVDDLHELLSGASAEDHARVIAVAKTLLKNNN